MFDYIIVGGGSAGCVLANRLSADARVRVGLFEAGPPDDSLLLRIPVGAVAYVPRKNRRNWAFETVPQAGLNGRRGYQPRGRTLGGSSAINAMCYIRGHRDDYDQWAAQGAHGWSFDQVLPYFKRSEHQERGADAFHGQGGPLNVADLRSPNPLGQVFIAAAEQSGLAKNLDFNGATQEGIGPYQVTQIGGERCSAARAYLDPVRARSNLTIETDAQVTAVIFEGLRAVGIRFRRNGVERELRASREVLLTAGALQSPQLLMLSGIGPGTALQALGITVKVDSPSVGANLQDHIDYTLSYRSPSRLPIGVSARGALDLWRAWREFQASRSGRLTTNFAEAGGFIKSEPTLDRPDLQLFFVVAIVDDHARKLHLGHGFGCHVCLLRPKSRGTLTLASADPLAAPVIDPNFLAEASDLETLVHGFK